MITTERTDDLWIIKVQIEEDPSIYYEDFLRISFEKIQNKILGRPGVRPVAGAIRKMALEESPVYIEQPTKG